MKLPPVKVLHNVVARDQSLVTISHSDLPSNRRSCISEKAVRMVILSEESLFNGDGRIAKPLRSTHRRYQASNPEPGFPHVRFAGGMTLWLRQFAASIVCGRTDTRRTWRKSEIPSLALPLSDRRTSG
jgi:hypothetical protein